MAGWVILNGSANAITVASPRARRARIARRVGSARAKNVVSSLSITHILYNNLVIYKTQGFEPRRGRCETGGGSGGCKDFGGSLANRTQRWPKISAIRGRDSLPDLTVVPDLSTRLVGREGEIRSLWGGGQGGTDGRTLNVR